MITNRAILISTAILAALSLPAAAQAPPDPQNPPSYQQPQPPNGPRLSPQELSNLVAPVALYPDLLLSQVLAASTYPAEISEAQQWIERNPALRGRELVEAAKQQPWDPSVQALVAFPQVLSMLTRDIQWTTGLGNAFLSQQADVMDAIQRLRASARDNGRLTNTPQQRVTYEQQNGQNAIVIQPTDPQMVYPPIYNPVYVWGPPAYGYYPPLGYPAIGLGISYAVGTFLGGLFAGLLSFGGWGWGLSWLSHGLFLNGLFFSHFGFHGYSGYGFHGGYGYASRAAWVHNPGHRLGVPYAGHYAAAHYGGAHYGGAQNGGVQSRSFASHGFASHGSESHAVNRPSYSGSSRQAEAYRGLSASAARGGGYNGYSSRPANSSNYAGVASRGTSRGSSSGHGWSPHSSAGRSSSPHYSAPKSSGHAKGGGHSGGHGHSGGGHSHGSSHKK